MVLKSGLSKVPKFCGCWDSSPDKINQANVDKYESHHHYPDVHDASASYSRLHGAKEIDIEKAAQDVVLGEQMEFDKEKKILSIFDCGIGMTKEVKNQGTIAKSGTSGRLSRRDGKEKLSLHKISLKFNSIDPWGAMTKEDSEVSFSFNANESGLKVWKPSPRSRTHMEVDLRGGYYDTGDNVKFNFPMAFTTTMLSWSSWEYGGRMGSQLGSARGSDVARAAASMVFRKVGPLYSKLLLKTSKKVMQIKQSITYAHSDSLGSFVCPLFLLSYSGYKDELIWGAAWLLRATNNVSYLNLLKSLGGIDGTDIFSWDSKFARASVLLSYQE
ncbi:hypothetical protein IFM89_006828 [Coptis chinensis]|uniref:cellulase n=1 Tax=Coptis chinensis TaxID=261450 RepID=A0A835ICH6_9MAGN|nr:hypothetical protein IFM89_006828 [Coptis chinensis]